MRNFLIGILLIGLTGCADNYIPITGEMVGAATDTAGYIKDASVAKELAIHATLRNRDNVYKAIYPESGTKVTFKLEEVSPGVFVQVISEISSRDAIVFKDPLPTEPSKHPVWQAAEKVLPSLINATLVGTLGYSAINAMEAGWKATAPVYNGPYQSYNPVTTEVVPVSP
jgi:hypothetical protein